MRLIMNADDFGLTRGVTLGILDSMEKGIVTETTAITNGLYFEDAMKEAKKRGVTNIGIHLNLTWRKPILPREEVSSLVNEQGDFHKIGKTQKVNYEEIEKELKAQVEKFLLFDIKPTHLDGHHHFYGFDKKVLDIVLKLAKVYELPVRCIDPKIKKYYEAKGIKTTAAFTSEFYMENVKKEILMELITKYSNFTTLEVMCHPAYVDEDLIHATSYNTHRKEEFDILTSKEIKNFIKEFEIELTCFNKI